MLLLTQDFTEIPNDYWPRLWWSDFVDVDGDGVEASLDCDDNDPSYPGATEILDDNIDQDCDGINQMSTTDADGDGFSVILDCDDNDPLSIQTLQKSPMMGLTKIAMVQISQWVAHLVKSQIVKVTVLKQLAWRYLLWWWNLYT